MPNQTRVVITGLGAVTPLGLTVEATWDNLVQGMSGTRAIPRFKTEGMTTTVAANVLDFDPQQYQDPKEARRTPKFAQYALAAATEAAQACALDPGSENPARLGVEIGSALGGMDLVEDQQSALDSKGPKMVNPSIIPSVLINAAACMVSIKFGITGGVGAPVAACATGTVAIGNAFRRLQWCDADAIIAGGSESVMNPLGVIGFTRLGACSSKNDTPERACCPFDATRDGTVVGEGAAVVVLETLDHARTRGARPLAEVIGYGCSADAYHVVAPDPESTGAASAIRNALEDACISPQDVAWICAHGTATPQNDAAETKAIKKVFGRRAYSTPVSSIKGALGHMLGAAGSVSAVMAVKAMQAGLIPPTINYSTPDPECDLDYVPNRSRPSQLDHVLINSFGFGGQNACLVLKTIA